MRLALCVVLRFGAASNHGGRSSRNPANVSAGHNDDNDGKDKLDEDDVVADGAGCSVVVNCWCARTSDANAKPGAAGHAWVASTRRAVVGARTVIADMVEVSVERRSGTTLSNRPPYKDDAHVSILFHAFQGSYKDLIKVSPISPRNFQRDRSASSIFTEQRFP